MAMSETRMRALEEAQSGIAKKVLSFVPKQEPWDTKQVVAEMARVTGSPPDRRVVEGCLRSLTETGLVKESPRGSFIRTSARDDEPMPAARPALRCVQVVEKGDPLDRLGEAAGLVRNLSAQLDRAATAIEDAALAMSQSIEEARAQSDQLVQLKRLLKSIGD